VIDQPTPMDVGAAARPNVVVVVMDCVRADDFAKEVADSGGMPFCRKLRAECVDFPRAISTSSWTVPSHVSLFTGLYPWEHGVHGKGAQKLDPSKPRLATLLRRSGYQTLSLSANANISTDRGLIQDFDCAGWGGWDENFLRLKTPSRPPFSFPETNHLGGAHRSASTSRLVKLLRKSVLPEIRRYPFLWAAGAETMVKIRERNPTSIRLAAPWIEPTLDHWLEEQDPQKPTYCFFNFLDCHEPYAPRWTSYPGLADWLQYARIRQDRRDWIRGYWRPSPSEFAGLHTLYRRSIRSLDGRLEEIVRTFREHGRWENTLFVLTSDHGQAFGEHDALFHMFSINEPLLRIPFWVRLPGARSPRPSASGWTSLIDIPATALAMADGERVPSDEPVPIPALIDSPRPRPLLAMSEGLLWDRWPDVPPDRRQWLDRVEVAAYEEDWKVIVNARDGATRAYDVAHDPTESTDQWEREQGRLAHLAKLARLAGQQLLNVQMEKPSAEVDARLAAWGY
jgi:arylsulfatase A-like enzyme